MSGCKAGSLARQKKGFNVLLSFVTSPSSEISLSPNPVWGRNEFSVLPLLDSSGFCSFVNIPKSTWHCSSCLSAAYLQVPLKGKRKPGSCSQSQGKRDQGSHPSLVYGKKTRPMMGLGLSWCKVKVLSACWDGAL